MKTYKLHELIEMARAGKKFRATRLNVDGPNYFRNERDFKSGSYIWNADHIIADWRVEFEPEVVEFNCRWSEVDSNIVPVEGDQNLKGILGKMLGKPWHIVATEIIEDK